MSDLRKAERVVARFAGTFTPQEWKTYKKQHPGANPADHTIEKSKKKPSAQKKQSPHSYRDEADKLAERGDHAKAFESYSAAAELFRRQNSPEAAKSMDDAAKQQAKKWKQQQK